MVVVVVNHTIEAKRVIIEAQNVEDEMFTEMADEQAENPIVTFVFPRDPDHPGPMTYLFKVIQSQPKARAAKGLDAKLSGLKDQVIFLSDGFIVKSKKK